MFVLLAWIAMFWTNLALASPANVTVDDQGVDERTGLAPIYTGPNDVNDGSWLVANASVMGVAQPDASQAHNGTWHDATYHPGDASPRTVEFGFVGTDVYAYFILGNGIPPVPLVTALTNLSFHVDNVFETTFEHAPDFSNSNYEYNVLGFSKTGMVNTAHQLQIQTTTGNASLVLFDYLVYTYVSPV